MTIAHVMAGDEILKDAFAHNAFQHFEIAAYKSFFFLLKEQDCGEAS
jgi:ferritin-like metal-binding protein YciE